MTNIKVTAREILADNKIWVVMDNREDEEAAPEGVAVYAESAEAAANQVVGTGPYNFAPEQNLDGLQPEKVNATDPDGMNWELDVFGPF